MRRNSSKSRGGAAVRFAVCRSHVAIGGLAEIAAGSIAMGLGDYLAAESDAEHYARERETERREVETIPAKEIEEVQQVLLTYELEKKESTVVTNALSQRPERHGSIS